MSKLKESITLANAGQVAASIPSLVGFSPRNSLIAVLSRQDRVIVTMRIDLDPDWHQITLSVTQAAVHVEADSVLLAVYTDKQDHELPFASDIARLMAELDVINVRTLDALFIDSGLWWSYTCAKACCPGEGKLVDPGLDLFDDGAEMQRREDITAAYTRRIDQIPDASAFKPAMQSLSADPLKRAEDAWEALQQLASSPADESQGDELRALLQLSCLDVRCRDYVVGRIANDSDPQPLIDAFVQVALCSPDEALSIMAGAAASLLAAFRSSTIPASCLVELAGDDSLAALVDRAIHTAMPPWQYAEILKESLAETMKELRGQGVSQ